MQIATLQMIALLSSDFNTLPCNLQIQYNGERIGLIPQRVLLILKYCLCKLSIGYQFQLEKTPLASFAGHTGQ